MRFSLQSGSHVQPSGLFSGPPLDGRGLAEEGRGMATQREGRSRSWRKEEGGSTEAGSGSQLCCGSSTCRRTSRARSSVRACPLPLPFHWSRSLASSSLAALGALAREASARPVRWRRRGGSNQEIEPLGTWTLQVLTHEPYIYKRWKKSRDSILAFQLIRSPGCKEQQQ